MATKKAAASDATSVEETIENAPGLEAGPGAVQSTTEETPAEADKTSAPNALDAEPEDPPVRAAKPDTPIAQVLTAGAGEHTPPDPDEFDSQGRPKGEEAET